MSGSLDATARCPCCGAAIAGPPAFVHDAVPVLLNVLAASEEEARNAATGRLELCECPRCGLVFNRAFAGVPYGGDYFLDATRSPRYRRHLDDVADRLAARIARRQTFSVVDVGAGQGLFLAHLSARLGSRLARAHGFDPAFRATEARLPENVGMTATALDPGGAERLGFPVDVVVTRHVVEHVLDPVAFLASIRDCFAPPFLLAVETPNVDHTLERGLLHDFCYEHCAMASAAALTTALARAGYERIEVGEAFDGEYLLAFAVAACAAPTGSESVAAVPREPRQSSGRLALLGQRFVPEHRERLHRARSGGSVALWGGAGKGALFAVLVDPRRELIDVAVDIHPAKHGFFLPGSGHRVVAPEEARQRGVRTVFVANPTYAGEVAAQCAAIGMAADIEIAGTPLPAL
jgi:2-polyprenyl-3-methyl-5-hydroxy-6-metoxy-1,4-benzoquinol methylase